MKLTKRRVKWVALTGLGLLTVWFVIIPMFFPWTEVNCSHHDVDINTGRIRISEYLFFCQVSEEFEETAVSVVFSEEAGSKTQADWRRVHTFSPGHHNSPHYIFHSATHQIRTLNDIWLLLESEGIGDLKRFKKATAEHLLALWKFDDSDQLAKRYLHRLIEIACDERPAFNLESVSELTMPVQEKKEDKVMTTVFFPDGTPLERLEEYQDDQGQREKTRYTWDSEGNLESVRDGR